MPITIKNAPSTNGHVKPAASSSTGLDKGDSFSFEQAFDGKEKCWAESRQVNRSAPRSITNTDTQHVLDQLDSVKAIIIKGSFDLEQITREAIARLVEMGVMEAQ
jgi:hypothetical protein